MIRRTGLLIAVVGAAILLVGCEKNGPQTATPAPETVPSFEMEFLTGILDRQADLAGEILAAQAAGDSSRAEELLYRFELLENEYDEKHDTFRESLTERDSQNLDERHGKIVRSLD